MAKCVFNGRRGSALGRSRDRPQRSKEGKEMFARCSGGYQLCSGKQRRRDIPETIIKNAWWAKGKQSVGKVLEPRLLSHAS